MSGVSPLPDRFIVAIDGPAGSGKSTLAKLLAQKIGAVTLDTGAMYRAVTAKALDMGIDVADEKAVGEIAGSINIEFVNDNHGQKIIVDGVDCTTRIRQTDVNDSVSTVAAHSQVRNRMVNLQRETGSNTRTVVEGRDIGTAVFPDAMYKFFLVADEAVRAERRLKQMEQAGTPTAREQVQKNISRRDRLDSSRADSPLAKAPGALEIDTSNMNIDEVLQTMLDFMVYRSAE